jgi:CRISPR-associated protein Cst2
MKVLLESILYTFVEPAGAIPPPEPARGELYGAVTISQDVVPAPCISPLKPDYITDIERWQGH